MRTHVTRERVVVVAVAVLSVIPFVIAATKPSFWEPEHSMAPVATAIYLAVVAALVVGRYRWAWVLLVVFNVASAVGWPFDSGRFDSTALLSFGLDLLLLLLLFSNAMRRRLRRLVGASISRGGFHRECRPAGSTARR
jgi:hypothetical protein